jgi:hypothetical protein
MYAKETTVPPERSKAEIEGLLRRYGADSFVSGWDQTQGREVVQFRCHDRFIRFVLAIPAKDEKRFVQRGRGYGRRTPAQAVSAWEQEIRRRWRALALVIKAKLEAVQTGITTFESEFLPHIVMPDGKTVSEHVTPAIAAAYASGRVKGLLPEFVA